MSKIKSSLLLVALARTLIAQASPAAAFRVEETSIADLHAAMRAETLSCRALVEQYLRRIDAYDKNGPALNALVVVNPNALRVADSLDNHFRRLGLTRPLHCIPVIVKDNFETVDLPTTAGSLSLQGLHSPRVAFQVRLLLEAGVMVFVTLDM